MCDIVFEKAKGRGGRTSVYVEAALMRNFAEFTKKNICARIYFLVELYSVDPQLY